jgi:ketosteroid isomerase-like protein
MTNPGEIVRRYFDAFYAGDSATARQHLADDFSFIGPDARFSSPNDFIKASAHVGRRVKSIESCPRRMLEKAQRNLQTQPLPAAAIFRDSHRVKDAQMRGSAGCGARREIPSREVWPVTPPGSGPDGVTLSPI